MRYLRNRPTRNEDVRAAMASAVLAVAVGAVSFYVTRLLIAREPLLTATTSSSDGPESGER